MPLIKSASKKAFKENIKREVTEGNKPVKQAVAIAYSVARKAKESAKPKGLKVGKPQKRKM